MIGGRGLCPQTPAVAPSAVLHPTSVAPHALSHFARSAPPPPPLPDQAGSITEIDRTNIL